MKKWIVTILGWALIAFAVGGLFTLAANLPAKGYELRFKELVSVLQANSLSKAAEDLGLNLALWKEESETITTDLGRSSVAQRISVYGSPGQNSGMDVQSVSAWQMPCLEVVK